MTKKNFIELANVIRNHNDCPDCAFTIGQISRLADFCQSQNPNFNRERWISYIAGECGPSGGKR